MVSPNGRATETVLIAASDVLPVRVENIPEELKTYHQWVAWRLEERDGRCTKVPIDAATEQRASVRDSRTWSDFEECVLRYDSDLTCHGIGFVFSSGDKFAGIDLDNCRDLETGALEPWAARRVDVARDLGAYAELSASGTGIHLIGVCDKLLEGGKRGPLELYTHCRFFTVTGWTL